MNPAHLFQVEHFSPMKMEFTTTSYTVLLRRHKEILLSLLVALTLLQIRYQIGDAFVFRITLAQIIAVCNYEIRLVLQDLTGHGARSQRGIHALNEMGRFLTWGGNPSKLQIKQLQNMADKKLPVLLDVPDGVMRYSSISSKPYKSKDAFSFCPLL
jgi:hypothetical protein